MTAHLFRDADRSVLTLQFRREEHLVRHPDHVGKVFVVDVPTEGFVGILEDLASVLDGKQVVPRIGLPTKAGNIESTVSKLRRLVERIWQKPSATLSTSPTMRSNATAGTCSASAGRRSS
ncbi:hypothetical protein [Peterkaempfera griseoplana]|uniref:hypothetical protein n=1 Tax=Peterkaempfera griseoplana TaxID=66896 RepID=UPI0012FF42F3|nr:hypothetical protein [Peterkaempfera griseoplana]